MANEYGWAKRAILDDVYLDEAYHYLELIRKRNNLKYRILLRIVENPHTDKPSELWDLLRREAGTESTKDDKLDSDGMELLKMKMSGNPRIIVK